MKISRIDIVGQNGNDAEIYHHRHKHGHSTKDGGSPTYKSWRSMLARCENRNNDNFHLYGGRGILVCDRWHDFTLFLTDMGERPIGTTIDRLNPDGDYGPGNCRWATSAQQAANKRGSIYVDFNGFNVPIRALAEAYGVPTTTIYRRFKQGLRGLDLVTRRNMNERRVGSHCPTSKLDEASVADIKHRLVAGESNAFIARIYGISPTTISNIKTGHTWGHVTLIERTSD